MQKFIESILKRIKGSKPAVIKINPGRRNSGTLVPVPARNRKVWYK